MPSLDKIKSKQSSEARNGIQKEMTENIPLASEEPFFLQNIARDYGCTEREFRLAFAEAIASTPRDLDLLVEEQINKAKGFLDTWGAYFILYQKLDNFGDLRTKLEDACSKYLIIENKLPREEGEEIIQIDKNVKKLKTKIERPTLDSKFKKKAIESMNSTDDLEQELEEMMELEGENAKFDLVDRMPDKAGSLQVATATSKPSKPKKKLKSKPAPPSKTKGHKRSIIAIFNGGEGSGKSWEAQTFPKAFTIDLEDKLFDLIDYKPSLDLQEGDINNLQPEDDYVVAVVFGDDGDIDYVQTEKNIEIAIDWFKEIGHQYHDTLIIDVGKAIREASIRAEEFKKGRTLGQYEYIPITKGNKQLLVPLIHFCRQEGKNLVIITHWEGVYEVRKNAQGFDESIQIGRTPDVKDWLKDLVTWRIDFLKPAESGFDEKFIIDFQKAPGEQYFKLDITNKNLYDIISNKDRLEEEKELFRQLRMKKIIAEKKEEKK